MRLMSNMTTHEFAEISKGNPHQLTLPSGEIIRRVTLAVSNTWTARGYSGAVAWVSRQDEQLIDPYIWKFAYRWGYPADPQFAAQVKISHRRIQLHRFVILGLERHPDKFVVPIDGNALHAWRSNLKILNKDELDASRRQRTGRVSQLTVEQQAWLDAECERTHTSKWAVIGALIQRILDSPFED